MMTIRIDIFNFQNITRRRSFNKKKFQIQQFLVIPYSNKSFTFQKRCIIRHIIGPFPTIITTHD